jgi:hypothetical protein
LLFKHSVGSVVIKTVLNAIGLPIEPVLLAVGAIIGAWLSSFVNGRYNLKIKELELIAQKTTVALQCAELKHQQLVACQDWAIRTEGKARNIDLWDPLQSVMDYLKGMDEFRGTGKWTKADQSHYPARYSADTDNFRR